MGSLAGGSSRTKVVSRRILIFGLMKGLLLDCIMNKKGPLPLQNWQAIGVLLGVRGPSNGEMM